MKNLTVLVGLGLILLSSILNSCKKEEVPTLTTNAVANITTTTATCGGTITDEGSGTIVERGICWSKGITPTIADNRTIEGGGAGTFISSMDNLEDATTYYVRAYATNFVGTGYGMTMSFQTLKGIQDLDGNIYHAVTIGTQIWMAENLKTTKLIDGTPILLVEDATEWIGLTTSAYCWQNNDMATYKATYGALYNWYPVNTGKLCPTGWHVPSDAEWTILTDFLGGESIAGGKMKEIGLSHWKAPNEGATNSCGFTSLPGGDRIDSDGAFRGIGDFETWWSSTEYNIYKPYYRSTYYANASVFRGVGGYKTIGKSIRCLKN